LEAKKINLLFVHLNFPGQFKELLNSLKQHKNVRLAFITSNQNAELDGVDIRRYDQPDTKPEGMIHYLGTLNQNLFNSREVTKQAIDLAREGFKADVVIGHIGWCGLAFMKDVFPEAKLIGYTEWFYRWENSWENFSGQKVSLNTKAKIRMQNSSSLIGLEDLDVSVTPTYWQQSVFPKVHQRNMHVIHEGIDTQVCKPELRSALNIPGCQLDSDAKIVTYIARSMEPARGFFSYMSAVEKLSKRLIQMQRLMVKHISNKLYRNMIVIGRACISVENYLIKIICKYCVTLPCMFTLACRCFCHGHCLKRWRVVARLWVRQMHR